MKIAFVGLGKLGFPCALAAATKHDVIGYDVSPLPEQYLAERRYPYRETGMVDLLRDTKFRVVRTVREVVAHAQIVFVSVQTPHVPAFEGSSRMPNTRADFSYDHLRNVVTEIASTAENLRKRVVVSVISTVLPGTSRREIYPLLNEWVDYVYNPFFIAQGTTIEDYLHPEFILLGYDPERQGEGAKLSHAFYATSHDAPQRLMSITSAELTKVAYNVFLGVKIVAANAIMEIAHKVGANCDDVSESLSLATDRVVSAKYMRGGMGDGGPCHPRDVIALSWLARELSLSHDFFGTLIHAREAQTEWLAHLVSEKALAQRLPIVVLGRAFKRGTNIEIGSPANLLTHILRESSSSVAQWDPHIDPPREFTTPAAFVVATNHREFLTMPLAIGSVVFDPWGEMPDREGCEIIRIGRS